MSLITGMVFMVALAVVTIIFDFYHYSVLDMWDVEFEPAGMQLQPTEADDVSYIN